jgi:hypothetical protein
VEYRRMKNFAAIAAILFFTACSASGPRFHETPLATQSAPADKARIIFFRPYDFVGSLRTVPIDVDGKAVIRLGNRGFASVDIVPGEHEIASSIWDIPGRFAMTVKIEGGQIYYIQVSPRKEDMKYAWLAGFGLIGGLIAVSLQDKNGPFILEPVEAEKATPLLSELKSSD